MGAASAADRIVTAFAGHAFHASDRGEIPIGATIGIAVFPEDGRTANELIAVADAVLYQAKRSVGHAGSLRGGGLVDDDAADAALASTAAGSRSAH